MFTFPIIVLFLFFFVQIINIHFVKFVKDSAINQAFVVFGIITVSMQFIVYINILDYSYSDDLLEYKRWYDTMAKLSDLSKIKLDDKDPGFSILLYFFSYITESFDQLLFILSVYVIAFNTFIVRSLTKNEKLKKQLYILFFFLTIILFNRLVLGHYTNTIRSFVSSSLLLFALIKYLDKSYYFLLLVPAIFLIHKYQFLIFIALILISRYMPIKLLLISSVVVFLNLPFGFFEKFITGYVFEYIDVLKTIYSSRILSEEMNFSWSQKIQIITLLIIPLAFLIRATTDKWTFLISVSKTDQKLLKFIITTSVIFLLLVDVLPVSERLIIFVFPLLYLLFIKYCRSNIVYGYTLLSVLLGGAAVYRNINDLIV